MCVYVYVYIVVEYYHLIENHDIVKERQETR